MSPLLGFSVPFLDCGGRAKRRHRFLRLTGLGVRSSRFLECSGGENCLTIKKAKSSVAAALCHCTPYLTWPSDRAIMNGRR